MRPAEAWIPTLTAGTIRRDRRKARRWFGARCRFCGSDAEGMVVGGFAVGRIGAVQFGARHRTFGAEKRFTGAKTCPTLVWDAAIGWRPANSWQPVWLRSGATARRRAWIALRGRDPMAAEGKLVPRRVAAFNESIRMGTAQANPVAKHGTRPSFDAAHRTIHLSWPKNPPPP